VKYYAVYREFAALVFEESPKKFEGKFITTGKII